MTRLLNLSTVQINL